MQHLKKLISPAWYLPAVRTTHNVLYQKRELFWEMAKLELRERYAGQALSLFWSIFSPLLTIIVYLFIFAFVFNAKMPEASETMSGGWGNSYVLYLLSGLIPWLVTQDIMNRATVAITSNASLVKQVVFPLEILPLKLFFPACINLGLTLGIFILFGMLSHGLPTAFIFLLPIIVAFHLLCLAGMALLLSAAGAYLRDLREIIQVICFLMVYAMPVFFAPGMIPDLAYNILLLNPLSSIIVVYHDVLYYGAITTPFSWIMFFAFSIASWWTGCRFFQTVKHLFGNVL